MVSMNPKVPHFAMLLLSKDSRKHLAYTFWSLVPGVWVAKLK